MTDTPQFMGLTRTYYFNGQLLDQNSFITEQQYIRDLNYNQNLALVTSGVIDGLEVTIADAKLQITTGAAMCDAGIMIFITTDATFSDFSSLTSGTEYALLLKYSDNTNGNASQLQESQIITESYTLSAATSGNNIDNKTAILCTFTYTTNGPTNLDTSATSGRVQSAMKLNPASGVKAVAPQPKVTNLAVGNPADGFQNPYTQPLTVGGTNVLGGWLNIDAELTAAGQSSALVIGINDGTGDIKFGNTEPSAALSIMTASVDDKDTLYVDATGQLFSQGDASVLTSTSNVSNAVQTLSGAEAVLTTPAVTGTQRYAIMGSSLSHTAAVRQSSGGQSLVSYDALVVLLVAAVNELNDRVEVLESNG